MNLESFLIGNSWWATVIVYGLILAVVGVLLAYRSQIVVFNREVKVELQKATWPWEPKEKGVKKYKELIDSTVIVIIAMLLLSGYVAGWDFIMNLISGALFRAPAPQ
ncbi:MAG TPA: preprotein translocase subunit SecE [Chthoniobacteraceae bacterium]|jgi:preprotein translocase subunit SecE